MKLDVQPYERGDSKLKNEVKLHSWCKSTSYVDFLCNLVIKFKIVTHWYSLYRRISTRKKGATGFTVGNLGFSAFL